MFTKQVKLFYIIIFLSLMICLKSYSALYIWTGANATSNWFDAGNWFFGSTFPGAGDDVIIPNSGGNPYPVLTGNVTINTLDIGDAAASVTLAGFNFTVTNDISSSGSIDASGGGNISCLNLTLNGGSSLTGGTGTITVNNNATGGGTLTGGSGNIDIAGSLTITNVTASSNLTYVGNNFNVVNFTHNNGTLIFDTTAGSTITSNGQDLGDIRISANKTLSGSLICGDINLASGTLTAGANNVTLSGDFTRTAGTFTSTGNITFNSGAAQSFDPTGSTFNNVIIQTAGTDVTLQGDLTANTLTINTDTTFELNGNDLTIPGAGITLNGTLILQGGEAANEPSVNTGTVIYNGSATVNLKDWTYYNLQIIGTGEFDAVNLVDVNNNLVVNNGTLDLNSNGLDVEGSATGSGTVSNGGAGTIDINGELSIDTFTASSSQTNVGGDFNVANYTHNGGLLVLDTTAGSNIYTNGDNLGNLRISANKTLQENLDCISLLIDSGDTFTTGTRNVTVSTDATVNGTLSGGTGNIDINGNADGSGTLTVSSGTIDIDGELTINTVTASSVQTNVGGDYNVTNFTHNNGLLIFDTTAGTTITSNGHNLGDIRISANKTLSGDMTCIELDLNAGTLTAGANNVTLSGDFIRTAGIFTSTANLTFNSGAAQSFDPAGSTINNVYIQTNNTDVTLQNDLTANALTINTNTTFDLNGNNLTIPGANITLNGTFELNGTETSNEPAVNTGTVHYYGSVNCNLKDWTYNILTITGTADFTAVNNVDVNSTLTVDNGNLNLNGFGLDVDSSAAGNGQVSGSGAGSIDIDGELSINTVTGSSTQTNVGGIFNVANYTHNNGLIIFDTTSGTNIFTNGDNLGNIEIQTNKVLQEDLTCIDLTITSGTFNAANRTINIAGDWNNTGGTFTSTNTTVNFNGTAGTQQVRTNGNSFNILTVSNDAARTIQLLSDITIANDFTFDNGTLDFNSGFDITVNNDFYINGGTFEDTGGGITQNTTITVAGNFLAFANNSDIIMLGTGVGHWILDVAQVGLATDVGGNVLRASWSNATDRPIASATVTQKTDCINWDILPPYVEFTRAVPGSNIIYIEFNEAVCNNITFSPFVITDLIDDNFSYVDNNGTGATDIIGITQLSTSEYYLTLDNTLSYDDILIDRMNCDLNEVMDYSLQYAVVKQLGTSFIENDDSITNDDVYIGLNFAKNTSHQDLESKGNIWTADELDGSEDAGNLDALVSGKFNYSSLNQPSSKIYYDVLDSHSESLYWDPYVNLKSRTSRGGYRGSGLWEYTISSDDDEIEDGAELSFIYEIDSGTEIWHFYRYDDDIDEPQNTPETYMVNIKEIKLQNNNVTILNNVLNPSRGDKTKLVYTIENDGPVSIVVYDLKSDVVKVLKQGNQSSGTYTLTWDGKNNNGKIVTRGVYFIRVRAPGIFNQIRKVLIIK